MKGKVSLRFAMPNLGRFRNRVQDPSSDLTKQLRDALPGVISDVVNGHQLEIRAAFIKKVNDLGLTYKSDAHKAKVNSVVESFFDVIAAPTPEELDAIVGADDDEPSAEVDPSAEAEAEKKNEEFE